MKFCKWEISISLVIKIKQRLKLKKLKKTIKVIVLLIAIMFNVIAFVGQSSKKITLITQEAPMEMVFSMIEKQTGFSFIYNKENLQNAKLININVNKKELEVVLQLVFFGQPFTYNIEGKFIIVNTTEIVAGSVKVKGGVCS